MECIVKIAATLDQVQFGTIAAANIAKTYSRFLSGKKYAQESYFVNAVELAVGEACTNSVKHQNTGSRSLAEVTIRFHLSDDKLIITVSDRNMPFAFNILPEPDVRTMQESGYGIHIIKKSMDSVSYAHKDGMNVVTMTKRIPCGGVS